MIERVLQVALDIVEAHQDDGKQYRHHEYKPTRKVLPDVDEIGSIQGRQDGDEEIAERPQGLWHAVLVDVLDLLECQYHF